MNEKLKAIDESRSLAEMYVAQKLDYDSFVSRLSKQLVVFDPLDESLDGLNSKSKLEIQFYFDWLGGEFDEQDELIPKRADWKYGESSELHGWVDKAEYYKRFSKAFADLKKKGRQLTNQ